MKDTATRMVDEVLKQHGEAVAELIAMGRTLFARERDPTDEEIEALTAVALKVYAAKHAAATIAQRLERPGSAN